MTGKIPEKLQTRLFENYTCTAVDLQDSRDTAVSTTAVLNLVVYLHIWIYSCTRVQLYWAFA